MWNVQEWQCSYKYSHKYSLVGNNVSCLIAKMVFRIGLSILLFLDITIDVLKFRNLFGIMFSSLIEYVRLSVGWNFFTCCSVHNQSDTKAKCLNYIRERIISLWQQGWNLFKGAQLPNPGDPLYNIVLNHLIHFKFETIQSPFNLSSIL